MKFPTPLILLALAAAATAVMPLSAAADHTAIHTLEQQIHELQAKLDALKTQTPTAIGTGTIELPAERVAGVGFSQTLRRGSRGEAVTRLQEFLKSIPGIYPEGLATGYFGSLTEAALKRFQAKYNIETVGIVGPKTRAKLNELLLAQAPPPAPPVVSRAEPPPAPTPPPPAPQAPAPPPPAPPAPPAAPPPTPAELGQPTLNRAVWSQDSIRTTFTHDSTSKTRGYVIRLRRPGENQDTTFGPYDLINVAETKTFPDGAALKRIGLSGWEWQKPFDFAANPEGTYTVSVAASGDGGAEGFTSPPRLLTLQARTNFADLYQGPSNQAVLNNTVSIFPLTMRLTNFDPSLYYRYTIFDGAAAVWESSYTSNTQSSQVQVSFPNSGSYPFVKGKSYRIGVDSFDNNTGGDSVIKQKPGETAFTYSP